MREVVEAVDELASEHIEEEEEPDEPEAAQKPAPTTRENSDEALREEACATTRTLGPVARDHDFTHHACIGTLHVIASEVDEVWIVGAVERHVAHIQWVLVASLERSLVVISQDPSQEDPALQLLFVASSKVLVLGKQFHHSFA